MNRKEMRRTGLIILVFIGLLLIQRCKEASFVENNTQEEQLTLDLDKIEDYRAENNLSFVEDSAVYPVQYAILQEGDGKDIELGDIVFYHYILRLPDGEVFATSIDSVATNNDIYSEDLIYEPLLFTYTTTGWSVPNIFNNSNQFTNHERGWKMGISAALKNLKVGGHVIVAVPSYLAYGPYTPINTYIPIIFEAYITNAK